MNKLFTNTILLSFLVISLIGTVSANSIDYPQAPNWQLKTQAGNNISLSDYAGKPVILHFWATWCPYCKKARPEWNKFKSMYENKTIKGHKLEFVEIDCDKDEATATQFKVESYPTIKLVKGGSIIEYDAKPKFETLKVFVESSL